MDILTYAAGAAQIAAVAVIGTRPLKTSKIASVLCLISSALIMQLCFGIFSAAEGAVFTFAFERYGILPSGIALVFIAAGNFIPTAAAFLLSRRAAGNILPYFTENAFAAAYTAQIKKLSAAAAVPIILIFLISSAVKNTFNVNTVSTDDLLPAITHLKLLFVLCLCLASVLLILKAYNRLAEIPLIEARSLLDRQYAEQTNALYNSTLSFRHDIKNHLLAINGMLQKEKYEQAQKYTDGLCGHMALISANYSTGVPAVDAILESKLDKACAASVICTLKIPADLKINQIDLCTIISNAVDNAVNACKEIPKNSFIEISGVCRKGFMLIKIRNSYNGKSFSEGTGLSSVRAAAERCGGSVRIKAENGIFSLSVMLVSSSSRQ